jgi:hypothetical protein
MNNTWSEPLPDITELEPMAQAIALADGFQLLVLNVPNESLASASFPASSSNAPNFSLANPFRGSISTPYHTFLENPDAITQEFLARNILDFLFNGESPPSDDIFDIEEPSPPGRPRVWILDLSCVPYEEHHQRLWDWFFKRLNEGRNTLMRAINANLIFCLPPHIASFWRTSAPDLWSVRSLTVDLDECISELEKKLDLYKDLYRKSPKIIRTLKSTFDQLPQILAHLVSVTKKIFAQLNKLTPTTKYKQLPASIIHLTDLHFSLKNSSKISEIVQALTKDMEALKSEIGKPALLLITGDLTQHADPKEYARAFDWVLNPVLEVLGLGREAVCIVPGNRDVDPKGVMKVGESGESSLRRALDNDQSLQNIFNDPFQRELHFQRMGIYRDAIDAALGHPGPKQDRREWTTHRFEFDGQKIGVACFNSTWRSNAGLWNHDRQRLFGVRPDASHKRIRSPG